MNLLTTTARVYHPFDNEMKKTQTVLKNILTIAEKTNTNMTMFMQEYFNDEKKAR